MFDLEPIILGATLGPTDVLLFKDLTESPFLGVGVRKPLGIFTLPDLVFWDIPAGSLMYLQQMKTSIQTSKSILVILAMNKQNNQLDNFICIYIYIY